MPRRPAQDPLIDAFCVEYIVDKNGKEAAIRAGYSANCAKVTACRLLKRPEVKKKIAELLAEQAERTKVTADRVINELARVGFIDPARLFDEDGDLLPIRKMPEEVRRAISAIEVEELYEGRGKDRENVGRLKKVKLCSKVDALELIGRHFKLFTDKVEHSGGVTMRDLVIEDPEGKKK